MKSAAELAREYPLTFEAIPQEDGGGFYAYSLAFPGIMGDGSSRDEAAEDFFEVLTDVIDKRISNNMPLPSLPSKADYSGKLNIRIGKSLHAMLAQRAQAESISINTLIIQYISYGLGAKRDVVEPQQIVHIHLSTNQDAIDLFGKYKQQSLACWKRTSVTHGKSRQTLDIFGGLC